MRTSTVRLIFILLLFLIVPSFFTAALVKLICVASCTAGIDILEYVKVVGVGDVGEGCPEIRVQEGEGRGGGVERIMEGEGAVK